MNIFDIVGPVMIGPSSSHTAGACRLGLLAAGILGERPQQAEILLHGSFARTYKGHGTDRALVAGLMGWQPDDVRIPNALKLAAEAGVKFTFHPVDLGSMAHPNSVLFRLTGKNGNACEVIGASVGGGQIMVTKVDGFPVELTGVLPAPGAKTDQHCFHAGVPRRKRGNGGHGHRVRPGGPSGSDSSSGRTGAGKTGTVRG